LGPFSFKSKFAAMLVNVKLPEQIFYAHIDPYRYCTGTLFNGTLNSAKSTSSAGWCRPNLPYVLLPTEESKPQCKIQTNFLCYNSYKNRPCLPLHPYSSHPEITSRKALIKYSHVDIFFEKETIKF
jgi:hypothetical protein